MALLQYKDPRAGVLYGTGNTSVTDQQIKDYFAVPGMTSQGVLQAALTANVSVDQINKAMNPDNDPAIRQSIDDYINSQGISSEKISTSSSSSLPSNVSYTPITAPNPVTAQTVNVGSNETVAGQFDKLLEDPNNPLAVKARAAGMQYANKRGLLNSDIGAEAAFGATMDRYLPIASQDASTYYDSNKTNAGNKLTADTFNNDQQLKTGMFNADQLMRSGMFNSEVQRDLYLNQQNLDRDYFIAGLDADTKTKIANIDAMSRDSGMMGEISRTYMSEVARISADPNMTTDAKKEAINNLTTIYESSAGIFPSIQKVSSGLAAAFGDTPSGSNDSGGDTSSNGTQSSNTGTVTQRNDGAIATAGIDGKIGTYGSVEPKEDGDGYLLHVDIGAAKQVYDTSDYWLTADEVNNVRAFESATGLKIDLDDVVPQELYQSIKMWNYSIDDTGMFVPIPVPGSQRADNTIFTLYAAALPKYQ